MDEKDLEKKEKELSPIFRKLFLAKYSPNNESILELTLNVGFLMDNFLVKRKFQKRELLEYKIKFYELAIKELNEKEGKDSFGNK